MKRARQGRGESGEGHAADVPTRSTGTAPSRGALSVLLTVRDEERQLPLALASVSGVGDEVVVIVDPRTRDRTRDVASRAGARILEHVFASSGAQCNWGLDQCCHNWVLVLDADERVTPELQRSVAAVLAAPQHPAYEVRRVNLAFGHRLHHGDWGRDWIVRLLDRRQARFSELAVHGSVHAATVGRLSGELEHHTLRSLAQYLPKVEEYARRGAEDLRVRGVSTGPVKAFSHASWRLFRGLVLKAGILDGGPGMLVAMLGAWGTFMKWTLAWETGRDPSDPPAGQTGQRAL